ncbi:TPA: ATP-binding cassette domain-containing protein, partial [Streptococcus pneumoniae]
MKLEIIDGQKNYGKRPILNQLNLVFQSGKIYGLKGDNGSGKTVLLKILAGYIKLDKGKVLQDGKVYGVKNHYIQVYCPQKVRQLIYSKDLVLYCTGLSPF